MDTIDTIKAGTPVVFTADGGSFVWEKNKLGPCHFYPGSFNPLHAGHKAIYNSIKSESKFYEISLTRLGKPDHDWESLTRIIQQFAWHGNIIVTSAPLFRDKIAQIGEGHRFHIGFDTVKRLVEMHPMTELLYYEATFDVYDRNGSMEDLDMPFNFRRANFQMPEELKDISSTKLRGSI